MTNQVIPAEATRAAALKLASLNSDAGDQLTDHEWARELLEAAAPYMLSHEREETKLAHLDAMVNRETASRLERAIAGVLELAAPQRHMVSAAEIREWIATALRPTP